MILRIFIFTYFFSISCYAQNNKYSRVFCAVATDTPILKEVQSLFPDSLYRKKWDGIFSVSKETKCFDYSYWGYVLKYLNGHDNDYMKITQLDALDFFHSKKVKINKRCISNKTSDMAVTFSDDGHDLVAVDIFFDYPPLYEGVKFNSYVVCLYKVTDSTIEKLYSVKLIE